jgi:hypothetical protein
VVHREGADDQVERSVGEGQRGRVTHQKRRPALVPVPKPVGIGPGTLHHGRIEVQAGHVQAALASQTDRQAARPATHFKHPCAVGGNRRDIGGNAIEKRAEQEPATCVVDGSIADENATWHLMASGGMAAMSHDGGGRGGRSGQEHELPRSTHHSSPVSEA